MKWDINQNQILNMIVKYGLGPLIQFPSTFALQTFAKGPTALQRLSSAVVRVAGNFNLVAFAGTKTRVNQRHGVIVAKFDPFKTGIQSPVSDGQIDDFY